MTLSPETKNWPQWLKDADTRNAVVEIVDDRVIWRGGEWHGDVWHGGEWHGGEWLGGVWRGGEWLGGVWHGGVWLGGVWCGGVWRGKEDRLLYMASLIGIVFDGKGEAVAYRTTLKSGHGRHMHGFIQFEGEYREDDLPPTGSGTCVKGIHVTSAACAWTYFGIDPECQFWRVTFKRDDLLDCDGEKARIRGGFFEKIARPF